MNYHNIKHDDMLNGDGIRVTLFVSGCSHHCPDCQNPQTWDKDSGIEFEEKDLNEIIQELNKDYVSGLTFSGGDPLFPSNIPEVTKIAKIIKQRFPTKSIWLYTGFLWEQIEDLEIMNYLDVVVDGEFKKELFEASAPWVGSTNQRVIDVKKSKFLNTICLFD